MAVNLYRSIPASRWRMTLVILLVSSLSACAPPLPIDFVDFSGQDQGAPIPQRVDSGLATLPDLAGIWLPGQDMGVPPATIERNDRVLLIDMSDRRSVSWHGLKERLSFHGVELTTRPGQPTVHGDDLDGRYGGLIIAAGDAPDGADVNLPSDAIPHLADYVRSGGALLLLTNNGWEDSERGQNDRKKFNELLGALDLRVHIQANTLIGDVYRPSSGSTPHHVSLPWAYVTPLEWSVGLPVGFPSRHLRPVEGVDALALGWASSLGCEDANVEVLVHSHTEVYSWNEQMSDNRFSVPGQPLPVAVQGDQGHGVVTIMPRSLLELPYHSAQGGDQPILEPQLLDGTRNMADAVITHWILDDPDRPEVAHPGCQTLDALPLPEEDVPPESMDVPPALRAQASPPVWANLEPLPSVMALQPLAWAENTKLRLMYGDLWPENRIQPAIQQMQLSDIDAYTATLPATFLIDFDPQGSVAQQIRINGEFATQAGLTVFLATQYRNENYDTLRDSLGYATDARGQTIDAPPPLSDEWWNTQIRPLLLGAATASLNESVQGLVLDLELYESGALNYSAGHGYDDIGWGIILQDIQRRAPNDFMNGTDVPQQDRRDWLINQGLLSFAHRALEDETARRASELLEAARDINPTFEVHLYMHSIQTSWFYRGLYRGFGRSTSPLLLLSYDTHSRHIQSNLREEGYAVMTLGGVLGARLSPNDLYWALLNSASGSEGYWLFNLGAFESDDIAQSPPAEYWQDIQRANQRLVLPIAPPNP